MLQPTSSLLMSTTWCKKLRPSLLPSMVGKSSSTPFSNMLAWSCEASHLWGQRSIIMLRTAVFVVRIVVTLGHLQARTVAGEASKCDASGGEAQQAQELRMRAKRLATAGAVGTAP
jgi:hypothetical protein